MGKKKRRRWHIETQRQPGRKPTTEKLAEALEQAGAPAEMIQRARKGAYDDYKVHVADNLTVLIEDAGKYGLSDIVQRAIEGEFDAQPWEAEAWRESPEGRAALEEFGL